MRVAVVGSRGYPRLDLVRFTVWAGRRSIKELVSGGAAGVDSAAEREAMRLGIATNIFRPKWQLYGRMAGFRRNKLIVENADIVIAFWDLSSSGTAHTIQICRLHHPSKPIRIYGPDGHRFHLPDPPPQHL